MLFKHSANGKHNLLSENKRKKKLAVSSFLISQTNTDTSVKLGHKCSASLG